VTGVYALLPRLGRDLQRTECPKNAMAIAACLRSASYVWSSHAFRCYRTAETVASRCLLYETGGGLRFCKPEERRRPSNAVHSGRLSSLLRSQCPRCGF